MCSGGANSAAVCRSLPASFSIDRFGADDLHSAALMAGRVHQDELAHIDRRLTGVEELRDTTTAIQSNIRSTR